MSVESILRTFAELSKDPGDHDSNVLRHDSDFVWLNPSSQAVFRSKAIKPVARTTTRRDGFFEQAADEPQVDRIIAAGTLHETEQMLRAGWIWVTGQTTTSGGGRRFCFPLVSIALARSKSLMERTRQVSEIFKTGVGNFDRVLEPVEDIRVNDIVPLDLRGAVVRAITASSDSGEAVQQWQRDAIAAASLPPAEWLTPDWREPWARSHEEGLCIFTGVGLYLDRVPKMKSARRNLLGLAVAADKRRSALDAIYLSCELSDGHPEPVRNVRPLTRRQLTVAANAGAAELSVISGAPGTGKTHVLSAIAQSAVAQAQSVLVVGSSQYATDVLLDHFDRVGGIRPVVFGSSRHREKFAQWTEATADEMSDAFDQLKHEIRDAKQRFALEREAFFQRRYPDFASRRLLELERAGDLDELVEIIDRYFLPKPADLFRDHGKSIEERLACDLSKLERKIRNTDKLRRWLDERVRDRVAIERASQRPVGDIGGIDQNLHELCELDEQMSRFEANLIEQVYLNTLTTSDEHVFVRIRSIMAEPNRFDRRRRLRTLDADDLAAARLWVGTVEDVDEFLPMTPALFDLVLVDEAAQIGQPEAAGALFRAKRAIVCGDPQQLRHQMDLSSDEVRAASEMFGTNPDVLDVEKHSALDIVAAKVPTQLLDEHFRSAPHLIEFSNRRFYGSQIKTVTRHPSNDASDHVHVEIVEDGESDGRTNSAEALRSIRVAQAFIDKGWRSIGFASPFEEQAELIEELIIAEYSLEEIDEYGFRVGSVHAFQGDERDVMILSWVLGANGDDRAWDEVNNDALFNVMVTRARDQVVVVTSTATPPGLAGEYVKWAEPLTDLVADQATHEPWVTAVVSSLQSRGVQARAGYRVGRHTIDVVAGADKHAVAIDCVPHIDGPEAELERTLLLRRMGWRTTEAFEHVWFENPDNFVNELLTHFPDLLT